MENFNTVPDKGTFGGSIEVINQNFLLAQQEMEYLRQLYNNLQKSQPIPVTQLPATGEAGKIYRLAGTNSYADYMYSENDLTTPIKMAEYNNGIDDEPIAGSNNLVKSGGVYLIKEETLEENREMVNSILEDYDPVKIIGDVNNAADEEDLTSVNVEGTDLLKFKDKIYNPLVYSGLGRKILRKNIVDGVNTLTQSMINQDNTIYVIQYDFTLGEDITVPANCVLEFDGGSISGVHTIIGNNTGVNAGLVKIFGTDVTLSGSFSCDGHIRWFGAHPDKQDNADEIQAALNNFYYVIIDNGTYNVSKTLYTNKCYNLKGGIKEYNNNILVFTGTGVLLMLDLEEGIVNATPYVHIEGITFLTDDKQSGYVHKPGTTAISSAREASGEINLTINCCCISGYEIGINTKHNSYYCKITNNRIIRVRYPINDINANNLQINNNRFSEFEIGINIIGTGPANIENNSFEVFSTHIVYSRHDISGTLNFNKNYIEDYGATELPKGYAPDRVTRIYGGAWCIYGSFMVLVAFGNIIDIPYTKYLFRINTVNFVSYSNKIELSSSSPIIYLYYFDKYNSKIGKYLSIHDDCNISGDTVPASYNKVRIETLVDTFTVVDVIDPVTKKRIVNNKNLAGYPTNGYGYPGSEIAKMPRFIVEGESIILSGIMTKTSATTDVSQPIMTLPQELIGFGNILNYNDEMFLKTTTVQGEDVTLKFVRSTGNFFFVSGNNTHDISLTGLIIPPTL